MSHRVDDEPFRGSYRDVVTHKLMLQDVARTSGYADAIRAVVKANHHVIDFGSGTGVLAIFAARAGAARVDAIERTAIVDHAKAIAVNNGHPEINFHQGDQESFHRDGHVDVIVSEWMGHFLFFESMLEPLISLRDRWLKPDGVMIPEKMVLRAALVTDEGLYEDGAFLESAPYGIDFGPIADLPLRQSRMIDIDENQVLTPYIELGTLDMHRVSKTPEVLSGVTTISESVIGYGMVGWFDAWLTQDIVIGTGPDQPHTHWRPIYFPFPEPFDCHAGRQVTVTIAPPRSAEVIDPTWSWSISDGKQRIFVDERESFARSRTAR